MVKMEIIKKVPFTTNELGEQLIVKPTKNRLTEEEMSYLIMNKWELIKFSRMINKIKPKLNGDSTKLIINIPRHEMDKEEMKFLKENKELIIQYLKVSGELNYGVV